MITFLINILIILLQFYINFPICHIILRNIMNIFLNIYPFCYIIPSSTLKKDKVAVTLVLTGFPPLLISKKMLYGNATLKYF